MLKPSSAVPPLSFSWTRVLALLVLALAAVGASAEPAAAQVTTGDGTSMFMPYIGFTTGGDTTTEGLTFGFSTAFIEPSAWGVEFDVAHSQTFNDVEFQSSGLTTVMVNVIAAPQVTKRLRPYAVAGIGAIRTRGCTIDCIREVSRTDFGLDAGGGALWAFDDMWGLRGDVRYFRYAQIHKDLPRLDNGPFDFWRVTFGGTISW